MAHPLPTIRLTVFKGDETLSQSVYQRSSITIGKMASRCDLVLDDESVSRMHAVIEISSEGVATVADQGSTNGTFVNGERCDRVQLSNGDSLLLGDLRVDVEITMPILRSRRRGPIRGGNFPPALDPKTYLEAEWESEGTGEHAMEVAVLWGPTLLSVNHYQSATPIVLGNDNDALLAVDEQTLGAPSYTLLDGGGNGATLDLSSTFGGGELLLNGSTSSLDEAVAEHGESVQLDTADRAVIRVGEFTVLVGFPELPAKPKTAYFSHVDLNEQIYMAVSLVAHLGFLILLSLIPEEQLIANLDPYARRANMLQAIQVAAQEKEEPQEEEEEELELEFKERQKKSAEKKQASVEYTERKKDKSQDSLLSKLSPEDRKKFNRKAAQNTGLNKVFNQTDLMAKLDSKDGSLFGAGKNARMAIASNAAGAPTMETFDAFGGTFSPHGAMGDGGFAIPTNSVGGGGPGGIGGMVAGLGKSDVGSGKLGNVGFSKKSAKVKVNVLAPSVSSGYDKETVRRVIRSHMGQIKWCYQQELQRLPSLGGKVVLFFIIGSNGSVQAPKIKTNTMQTNAVGTCIARKSARWRFPPPPSGGVVKVSYPFLFKATK